MRGSSAIVVAFLTFAACKTGATRPGDLVVRGARDVVLVTIDTLRADATGYSGSGKVETPTIDRLAAGGVVFETAHAHAVVTLPSHCSILTGLYPYQHGVRDNAGFTLRGDVPTLASILKDAGYATGAFVSAFPLDRRFGLARGFDVYDDEFSGRSSSIAFAERRGEDTIARARAWWDAHAGSRRFLWVHLFTPHFPYEPVEPFASKYRGAPYYGEVALADEQIRPLLGAWFGGAAHPPLVVLTADHGESLGEHGEQTHGLFAYEATLRVPLVLWAPGMLAPARIAAPARHVDIVPSVLDLLGVKAPAGLAGRSLFSEPRSGADAGSYFESLSAYFNRGWAPLYGRIDAGRKAIRLPVPELYDLERDPAEAKNLANDDPQRLASILAHIDAGKLAPEGRERVEEEAAARLRSLGYISGNAVAAWPGEFDATSDPKNLVDSEHVIDEALSRYRSGDFAAATALFETLIGRQPRMTVAYSHLASIYTDLGRLPDAIRVLAAALSRGAGSEEIRTKLALALERTGEIQRAWDVLSGDRDSRDPETQCALGRIAAGLGRSDEARLRFATALLLDPSFPQAHVDLGILHLQEGRLPEAETELEGALKKDESLADGWNALGVVRLRNGDPKGAIGAWERAVAADPRLADALFNLALARGKLGEPVLAAQALERYIPLVDGEEKHHAQDMLRQLRP